MLRIEDIPEDEIVFYDIETGGKYFDRIRGKWLSLAVYAPYCELKMIGYQVGFNGEPQLVSKENAGEFRELVSNPNIIKVSWNGINFDDIVLWRYGFYVNPVRRYDMYLALKTIHPSFPSFSLKFLNLALNVTDDLEEAWHEPEYKVDSWLLQRGLDMEYLYSTPEDLLGEYCKHDVRETCNAFRAIWEVVQRKPHWRPYRRLELAMGEPLHEMIMLGVEYVNPKQINKEIVKLERERQVWIDKARKLSGGVITNVTSSKQVGKYFKEVEKLEVAFSDSGNFEVRKADLLELLDLENEKNDKSRIARCCYEARDITKVIGYFRSYLRASEFERRRSTNNKGTNSKFHPIDFASYIEEGRLRPNHTGSKEEGYNSEIYIPKAYYLSAARTRRFSSGSRFGINFQNQNDRTKVVQLVPEGWLGWWLDSTQIENVVHIWASSDEERRKAYEADPNWNEYVWITNTVYGTDKDKAHWDSINSQIHPQWTIYKQFKTVKLALNFGMGPRKFSKETGLTGSKASKMFDIVHMACPAIRELQEKVRSEIMEKGYIMDPFGHIYSGDVDSAYKIVAYLVQGCGTGSIPKAMTVANYETLHKLDSSKPLYRPYVRHPYTKRIQYGVLCGTTHDECAGRISLGLPTNKILEMIEDLKWNMEERFSSLFDNIPLRAKLYVSITNAAEHREISMSEEGQKELVDMISYGKRKAGIISSRSIR